MCIGFLDYLSFHCARCSITLGDVNAHKYRRKCMVHYCYYVSFRTRLLLRTCKTSSGKRYHLHLIYLLHLHLEIRAVLDFVLCWKLVRFKMPYMQFLFVRPRFCLRLPSDSASRRTPLPLANSSYCQVCSGLSPPSCNACRAHNVKPPRATVIWSLLEAFVIVV